MSKRKNNLDQNNEPTLKEKPPVYKRWWFIALAVFIGFGAIGSALEDTEESAEPSEPEVEIVSEAEEEELEDEEEEDIEEEPEEPQEEEETEEELEEVFEEVELADESEDLSHLDSVDSIEDHLVSILNEDVGDVMTVTLDKDDQVFYYTPLDEGVVYELILFPDEPDVIVAWATIVDNLTSISNNTYDMLGSGYSHVLVNPSNPENVLLYVIDGLVFYDVMDD